MRLATSRLVDRNDPVTFKFDGREVQGFTGDTVASALLASGQRLMGRSFKYHRPRGVLTAGSEEPNALVTIGSGARQEPNVRATMQEIYEGLEVFSQNSWPSLKHDFLGVNDLAAPFLGAGFYYKTFMWPRKFWETVYEPIIRRAAGLGGLGGVHNDERYEKAHAFCDVLIVGAGPAGLMAALVAAGSGADVILADEDAIMGGRLNAERDDVGGVAGNIWAAETLRVLNDMPNVRLMTRTTVTGAYDQGTFGALERVSKHRPSGDDVVETFWRIVAKRSILTAGALERPIAFQNNDRPGIMTAGAVRAYVNRWGVSPGKRVALFCNNDDAHRTVLDLVAAGVSVAAVIDSRADAVVPEGAYDVYRGAQVVGTSGRLGLASITVENASGTHKIKADCLALSGGWNPSVHLTCHMNARPEWCEDIASFVPRDGAIPGMIAAGACNGVFSLAGCLQGGAQAAKTQLAALGIPVKDIPIPQADDAPYRITPLWAVAGKGRAWLDFQNDVTVKDVKQAATENFRSVEHMKRYTTQGMAPDQGKNSNVAALAVLADATGRGIPETGTTTFRPPYSPVSIASMGAGSQGMGFAPCRLTTSHDASIEAKAPMIEAGLWYRPSYFPVQGETTWRQSCDREVGYVRGTVGVCDVSTLGKIDIQGSGAAELLDFVYTNVFSSLKTGRVRYGLMLREDGCVMDDGTASRLGPDHFVMTTTTAAAGEVMRHLDFVSQCLRPDLDVRFTSVTEQWAQFAVAGPQSRALLNDVLDAPLENETWPFMACGDVRIGGVNGRLFRISFSGEHAYEVAVPARYGESLYKNLVTAAQKRGGGAYGMEALNVLRIEKGHITHAEIHGRTTAFDIGFGKMVSAKKDCIGKTMSEREGLMDTDREQLVGLRALDGGEITAGAHVFDAGAEPVRVNGQGYVTSAAFSPTLGQGIGLAFIKNAPARHGEVMEMVDHMRGIKTRVELCNPVFVDPEGGRTRG